MNNEVSGRENRAAGRDFSETNMQVDQLIGRDIVNISLSDARLIKSPLIKKPRRDHLNGLVKDVVDNCNVGGFTVWKKIHAEIGVESINEITDDHYPKAIKLLQTMLDNQLDIKNCNMLVHKLLKKTEGNSQLRERLFEHCDVAFANRHLKELEKPQLQQALGWLIKELNEDKGNIDIDTSDVSSTHHQFTVYNPIFIICIFIFGFLVGLIF